MIQVAKSNGAMITVKQKVHGDPQEGKPTHKRKPSAPIKSYSPKNIKMK